MKPLKDHEIEEMLSARSRPDVPVDLLSKLKADIPQALDVETSVNEPSNPVDSSPEPDLTSRERQSHRRWLIAATLVTTLGGSFLAYKMIDRPSTAMFEGDILDGKAVEQASAIEEPERGQPHRGLPTVADPVAPSDEAAGRSALGADDSASAGSSSQSTEAPESTSTADALSRAPEQASPSPENRRILLPAPELESEQIMQRKQELRERLRTLRDDSGNTAPPPPPPMPPAPRSILPQSRASAARIPEPKISSEYAPGAPKAKEEIPKPEAVDRQLDELAIDAPAPPAIYVERLVARAPADASVSALNSPVNDAEYDDVYFKSYGTNPFIDTEDDALSTFALDVDTASYTVARRYIRDGHLPPSEAIRVEEFINSFDYGDKPPRDAEFALHAEGAPSRFGANENYYLLRFNLRGRDLESPADRKSAQLTFVVDVSGSMDRGDRLGLVKRALGLLVDQLRDDDRVALVVYGSTGRIVLEPTADKARIRQAIEVLRPEGSTNAEEGLRLAYEMAARTARRGVINRVILCSDGVANVGATSAEALLDRVRDAAAQGIELTTVGFGMGNYNDVLMEQLADRGNGRYAYVDEISAARRIFVEDLTGTLQTLAAEARVQVEFNPELVSRYRLVGYENRDIADERFRDDTVDAGEIGVGHSVTALYEVKLTRAPKKRDELAVLRLRYGSIDRGEMVEVERRVSGRDFADRFEKASTSLRLTALVAEFGEILKGSYWARGGDLDQVYRLTQELAAEHAGDRRIADLVAVMAEAAALREAQSP